MTWKNDIQSNILRGLPATHTRYLFLRSDPPHDPSGLRQALRALLLTGDVKDAQWQRTKVERGKPLNGAVVNVALTRPGLELLAGTDYVSDERRRQAVGIDQQEADAFAKRLGIDGAGQSTIESLKQTGLDLTVTNSMYRRRDLLREAPPPGGVDTWSADWRQLIHALVWISGTDVPSVQTAEAGVLSTPGVTVVNRLSGRVGADRIDPFRFRDGTSQPAVDGFHERHEIIGRGAWSREGWRGLRPGEFVVGEKDEGHEVLKPQPERLLRHCTYLAFRQIRMWPDRIASVQNQYASNLGATADDVGTWLVGRRRPDGQDQGSSLMGPGPDEDNDFIFGYDPEGEHCPLGAHIRRANPRDSMSKFGNRVNRHRLIRRGMPYRIPAAETAHGTEEWGLAFIALQSRLQDGFEFVQAHWLNSGPTLHVGEDPDPIAGIRARDVTSTGFVRQGSPAPVIALDDPPLTEILGGEYFVLLTVPALRNLLWA